MERLSQLSSDVLDYSKVRAPHCETLDLAAYLGSLVEPFLVRAEEAKVKLTCQGPPCAASLDKPRFVRVIENLIANALDAMAGEEGGEVAVQWCARVGGVEIVVSDNGKGIPKKVLKRIFEPFFSHGKVKGTGLGMATVKKIVEEHRGTVTVQSEEGKGTRVILFVPTGPPVDEDDDSTGVFLVLKDSPA